MPFNIVYNCMSRESKLPFDLLVDKNTFCAWFHVNVIVIAVRNNAKHKSPFYELSTL